MGRILANHPFRKLFWRSIYSFLELDAVFLDSNGTGIFVVLKKIKSGERNEQCGTFYPPCNVFQ